MIGFSDIMPLAAAASGSADLLGLCPANRARCVGSGHACSLV